MSYQLQFCWLGNSDEAALDEIKAITRDLEQIMSERLRKLRELKKRCKSITYMWRQCDT